MPELTDYGMINAYIFKQQSIFNPISKGGVKQADFKRLLFELGMMKTKKTRGGNFSEANKILLDQFSVADAVCFSDWLSAGRHNTG
jgi:hypothetical protein